MESEENLRLKFSNKVLETLIPARGLHDRSQYKEAIPHYMASITILNQVLMIDKKNLDILKKLAECYFNWFECHKKSKSSIKIPLDSLNDAINKSILLQETSNNKEIYDKTLYFLSLKKEFHPLVPGNKRKYNKRTSKTCKNKLSRSYVTLPPPNATPDFISGEFSSPALILNTLKESQTMNAKIITELNSNPAPSQKNAPIEKPTDNSPKIDNNIIRSFR